LTTPRAHVDHENRGTLVATDDRDELRDDPRYHRLMEATRAAAARGYDAVSMRDLAQASRMSLTTVYQFCSSKDHLIAEAHVDRMLSLRDRVVARPPRGRTAVERVLKVVRGIVAGLDRDDPLSWALMRAMYAPDPAVRECRRATAGSFSAMVDAAIGADDVADRGAVIATLGHVVDSVVLGWVHGSLEADDAYREIARAVRLVVRPAPPRPAVPSGPTATSTKAKAAKGSTAATPRPAAAGRTRARRA
jgi:AcrR family transcriptional regulator